MSGFGRFPTTRLRRLRYNSLVRDLVRETHLCVNDLIMPLFIRHGKNIKNPIASMPGFFQLSVNNLEEEINEITKLGIKNILLFGIPEHKDELGSDSYSDDGIIQTAIKLIKKKFTNLLIITDVCFCEYTTHGHCGCIKKQGDDFELDNDATLELLAKQAVSHAKAGADIVAPSCMIDGMVSAMRAALDKAGYIHIPIFSYSAKYASAMYGPFREATEGAPQFGDRRSYQMNAANTNEAIRECDLDIAEGADMLMVKPAHTYLDIIQRVKAQFPGLSLGAYHTSGEFAMLKAAAEKGWIDERAAVLEVLTAIKRAGADFIITYYAKDAARWLNKS